MSHHHCSALPTSEAPSADACLARLPKPLKVPFEPVAIIGIGCKYPQILDPDDAWKVFSQGLDVLTRWESPDPTLTGSRGFVDDAVAYDYKFWNVVYPRLQDPQMFLLHEVVYNALENAGYCPTMVGNLPGRVGVYGNMGPSFYSITCSAGTMGPEENTTQTAKMSMIGSSFSTFKSLVSLASFIHAHGPILDIASACSSSASAVWIATQQLQLGVIDLAVTGYVTLAWPREPVLGYSNTRKGLYSVDGYIRPFDRRHSGFVPSEGAGSFVLKRLADAVADNDVVMSVIVGAGQSSDPFMLPSQEAISAPIVCECIRDAMQCAGIKSGDEISYIECHGAATTVGDFAEITALNAALQVPGKSSFCAIGSVKANLGHIGGGAGIPSLMKGTQILMHNFIPPLANFEEPEEATAHFLSQPGCPVYIPKVGHTPATPVKYVGVQASCPGGGTHLMLAKAPPSKFPFVEADEPRRTFLLCTSTKTATSNTVLSDNTAKLVPSKVVEQGLEFAFNAEYILQARRERYPFRSAVVMSVLPGEAPLAERIQCTPAVKGNLSIQENVDVGFIFSGFGGCGQQCAKELYVQFPVFKAAFDRCAACLKEISGGSFVLTPDQIDLSLEPVSLAAMSFVTMQICVSELLISWGIVPTAGVVCHSLGEYPAAVANGVLTPEECLKITKFRFEVLAKLPKINTLVVSMIAVKRVSDMVAALNKADPADPAEITVINSSTVCIVSGPDAKIEALTTQLQTTTCKIHKFSPVTSHSAKVAPILDEFRAYLTSLNLGATARPAKYKCISGLTADWGTGAEFSSVDHYCNVLANKVNFHQAAQKLMNTWIKKTASVDPKKTRKLILLEIGASLVSHVQDIAALECGAVARAAPAASVVPISLFLHHQNKTSNAAQQILTALGTAWTHGMEINWQNYHTTNGVCTRHAVQLCRYPWERQPVTWVPPKGANITRDEYFEKLLQYPDAPVATAAKKARILPTIPGNALGAKEMGFLADKWEAFAGDVIDADANFFDFGATSMAAMRMVESINKVLGLQLQASAWLREPTFIALVQAYSNLKTHKS